MFKIVITDVIKGKDQDDFTREILREQAISLKEYIKPTIPEKSGNLNKQWYIRTTKKNEVILGNRAEYFEYLRDFYIRRLKFDIIDDNIKNWTEGKPPRSRLSPPELNKKVRYLKDDGSEFIVTTETKTASKLITIDQWKRDAEEIMLYLESVSPYDTGLMVSRWNYEITPEGIRFWNDTEYLRYVRDYYIRERQYDFVKDAVLDWNLAFRKQPRLEPVGRIQ